MKSDAASAIGSKLGIAAAPKKQSPFKLHVSTDGGKVSPLQASMNAMNKQAPEDAALKKKIGFSFIKKVAVPGKK